MTLTARGRTVATVVAAAGGGLVAGMSAYAGYLAGQLDMVNVWCFAGLAATGCGWIIARVVAQYGSLR